MLITDKKKRLIKPNATIDPRMHVLSPSVTVIKTQYFVIRTSTNATSHKTYRVQKKAKEKKRKE